MTHADEHDYCLICLGKAHDVRAWEKCQKCTPKAHADRVAHIKAMLWE